ncbi:Holliday junction branch migration protein RuvA [Laceyella sacchari]|uniref:Holliday junction branch migration complex subunit RuvA n=1 Tax=Laceyella tengchongensis TaxID=574699 RepID=A0AA46AGF2_9BACL|nr:Holliday junction branch migration protein RuvA [Laceyella tengchongensis]AUS08459.1 Holliday junction branch migration protein RuvA [Laceyella sacchari]SMP28129.1 Holliday junction DNA helicase subunit RuvA [Laceyella tengchongensis]
MIEFVKGEVVYHEADYLAVDVRGLGHQVFVPNPFAFTDGEEVMLYTHFVVREDAQLLYGFKTKRERNLFRLLLEVSGVGPKAALAMLTHMSPEALVRAIHIEDVKTLTKLPGVGKKTAQRLVLDLKDKLAKLGWEPSLDLAAETASLPPVVPNAERDVIDALLALGYNEEEAEWAVRESGQRIDASVSTEEWIKKALQAMMKR